MSFGLLVLLLYPFAPHLAKLWLSLAALASLPYYYLYGRDLKQSGYHWGDLLRVYALNLMLVPVNLAGVLRSIQQLWTGRKAEFGRTPKVANRTAVQPFHVMLQWGLFALLTLALVRNVVIGTHFQVAFATLNFGMMLYGLVTFIGFRPSWDDIMGNSLLNTAPSDLDRYIPRRSNNPIFLKSNQPSEQIIQSG
jgi:hypothetical protein